MSLCRRFPCALAVISTLAALAGHLPAQGAVSISVPLPELVKRAVADSNDPAAHYNLALGYWSTKKWPDVERELKATLALDPRFAEAHLAMAFLQVAANTKLMESTDPAKKDSVNALVERFNSEYRHAFLINPKVDMRIMASTLRGSDELALRAVYGPIFSDYIAGMTLCRQGKYAECEDRLGAVITMLAGHDAPDDAYWHRGLAAAHQSHYAVAAEDFKLLVSRDAARVKAAEEKGMVRVPIRSNEYRYFQAVFLHLNGDVTQAFDLYHEVLEKDLGMYIAHVRLAEIFEAKRSYPEAIQERERAINANPDDPSLILDLGITLGKAGKLAESEATLRKAAAAMPRNIEAWFWLGLACEQTGNKNDARAAYERVIALAPTRLKARADQAQARIAKLQ